MTDLLSSPKASSLTETASTSLENRILDYIRISGEKYFDMINSQGSLETFFEWIAEQEVSFESTSLDPDFFEGERAFYRSEEDQALTLYLKAKDTPFYTFFCYRASSKLAHKMGENDKALNFCQKALAIVDEDLVSLSLLEELMKPQPIQSPSMNDTPSFKQEVTEEVSSFATPSIPTPVETKASSSFTYQETEKKGLESIETALEGKMKAFQRLKASSVQEYLNTFEANKEEKKPFFYLLDEKKEEITDSKSTTPLFDTLLSDHIESTLSPSFFFRWQGKGVLLNPSPRILEQLQNEGLHIKDVDFVIASQDKEEIYQAVKKLYDFVYKVNLASSDVHVVQYFLTRRAHQILSPVLKPRFKQERGNLHALELFQDTQGGETIELDPSIALGYFSATPSAEAQGLENEARSLGLRFDLKSKESAPLSFGFLPQTCYNEMFTPFLKGVNFLVLAFGETSSEDYERIRLNKESLGYFGAFNLIRDIQPKLVLLTEFSESKGDIRIEVVKKLRKELQKEMSTLPAILPSDASLMLDLLSLKVRCSASHALIDANRIQVVKTHPLFGLHFLSPDFCL